MGIFSNPYKPKPDKFSRGALLARYNKGRLALLLLAAGTLFNALMDRWAQSAGTGTGMPYGALLFFILAGGPQALIWTLADCAIHIWMLVWVIRALQALSMRKFMKPEEGPPED